MPINVRRSGTWTETDRVYVHRRGAWTRVISAWVWGTHFGITKWWPMFDYTHKIAVAPTPRGGEAAHTYGVVHWSQTTDPTIIGYRLILRSGSNPSGPIHSTYPPEGHPPMPVTQTSYTEWGFAQDQTWTWTMVAYDEFGHVGPESAPLRLNTGHPQIVRTSAGYPGFTTMLVAPDHCGTYQVGAWRYLNNVTQGTPAKTKVIHNMGCVTYNTIYNVICYYSGLQPPRNIIQVAAAHMQGVTRIATKQKTGTVKCEVAPGSINWINQPVRHAGLQGHHAETWFASPAPGESRGPFQFANDKAILHWVQAWLGVEPAYGYRYNGLIIRDDHGRENTDGEGYVSLAEHDGGHIHDWVLNLTLRFAYEEVPYSPPTWW